MSILLMVITLALCYGLALDKLKSKKWRIVSIALVCAASIIGMKGDIVGQVPKLLTAEDYRFVLECERWHQLKSMPFIELTVDEEALMKDTDANGLAIWSTMKDIAGRYAAGDGKGALEDLQKIADTTFDYIWENIFGPAGAPEKRPLLAFFESPKGVGTLNDYTEDIEHRDDFIKKYSKEFVQNNLLELLKAVPVDEKSLQRPRIRRLYNNYTKSLHEKLRTEYKRDHSKTMTFRYRAERLMDFDFLVAASLAVATAVAGIAVCCKRKNQEDTSKG